MGPCVYTTQHPEWLDAALKCNHSDEICFHSRRKWATARNLLERHGTLPLLIRRQEGEGEEFVCRYIADLRGVHFRSDFENDIKRLAWLDEKLWLQRETIRLKHKPQYPTWEHHYKELEVDHFIQSTTWYIISNLREIKPLPLPLLHKLDGNHPLASNYIRGYALCHYPEDQIVYVHNVAPR